MAKRQSQPELPDGGRGPAQKAILFEITGNERSEKRAGDELRMHRMAALSLEEVIRYMRVGHPDFGGSYWRNPGLVQLRTSGLIAGIRHELAFHL